MPLEVDEAIHRNMDAVARLLDMQQRSDLDIALRSELALAARDVRIANQHLEGLATRCPLCATTGFRRVCVNCGNHRSAS